MLIVGFLAVMLVVGLNRSPSAHAAPVILSAGGRVEPSVYAMWLAKQRAKDDPHEGLGTSGEWR